jgi:putative transposase
VFFSLCYVVLRRVRQLAALRSRSNDLKELEIVVLRHELAILRRRTRRPVMTWTDRLFLAAASRLLTRARWRSFIITPRRLLCAGIGAWWRSGGRTRVELGRPPIRREIRGLVRTAMGGAPDEVNASAVVTDATRRRRLGLAG